MSFRVKSLSKLNPGFKQFLVKTLVFVGLFMAFIFLIGTKLYQYGIIGEWKIGIWGRVGYILLFSIAGFILLYREKLLKLESFKYKAKDFSLLIFSVILLGVFYFFEINANIIQINALNIILVHFIGVSIFLFLGFGVYGLEFIKDFIKKFKKELFYFLIFGIITASLMNFVWSLWPYFSSIVLNAVSLLLNAINADFRIIEPRTIIVGDFGAQIAEPCSGIYSIFLFTALYLFIIFVDWKKINKKKAALLFIPAVAGAFLINILRVFLLFLVGAFVSKDIAMGLYHSYTGMIFFLLYFAIFWLLFYKWMKDEKTYFIPKDSLYRNSIYLMINTIVITGFGFIFWMINTRLYSAENVGLATALISVTSLIAGLSVLGLNIGLIRYLPKAENKNKKINTSFTLVTISTIIITVIFLMFSKYIAPKLLFVHDNMILSFVFILFMIVASIDSLMQGIFTAYRKTKYILFKNTIFSVLKIIFPFFLVFLGAYGIFSSYMIASFMALIVSFIILVARFNYKPKFVFYDKIIKKIGKYSFGNYIAGFIGGLPTMLLPLLILNKLGAEQTAYYYVSMMIAALLFAIPSATSNSLFAEGSHNQSNLKHQIKKSIKIIFLLLIPAIAIIIVFGKYLLLFFGKNYSSEGFRFLQLIALSCVFVGINSIFGTLLRVKKKIKSLIFISIASALLILGLSWMLIDKGLLGIGYAYLIGQVVIVGVYLVGWKTIHTS